MKNMKLVQEDAFEEKTRETKKRQEAERRLLALQAKYEEEVRLRLDFEIKINKLHNLTVAFKNHEDTLNRRIEVLEASLADY